MIRWFAALVVLLGTFDVSAEEVRVALLVGHPFGGDDLTPLRYTANDVQRMGDVLTMVGEFEHQHVHVSFGESVDELVDRFAQVRASIRQVHERGQDNVMFVFYYSGHAKDGELRMGESRISFVDLKDEIEATGADLRIALLDSCASGSITRLKGAVKGAPIAMAVEDTIAQEGSVFITASSSNEDAQESDAIQGSFFTHFLTSGLRGAADENEDGTVTLSEAYAFTYGNTVGRTVGTRGGTQHPTYKFDLQGSGDVHVTHPGTPPSSFYFAPPLGGHFVVFDDSRRVVVAEFTKDEERPLRVAVAPGNYVVKKRETDHLRMQRYTVERDDDIDIDLEEMERVSFADDYAKGATVTLEEVRHGEIGVSIALGLSGQTFLSTPVRDDFIPNLTLLGLNAEFSNLLRRGLGVRLDLGLGASGPKQIALQEGALIRGSQIDMEVFQISAGLSLIYDLFEWKGLRLRPGVRLGWVRVQRTFPDREDNPDQTFSTMTPGASVELSYELTSWLTAALGTRVHYMFFEGDESVSVAFLDSGLSLAAAIQ